MHYTVIQHAAQEAARYLSKAPVSEMNNPNRAITVAKVAEAIIKEELSELSPGAFPYVADMLCDGVPCVGYSKPVTVSVSIQLIVQDIFFPGYTALEIPLMVSVKYPYLGR